MTEITPLSKQDCNDPLYNAASNTKVHKAEREIPLLEIVEALFLEWQRSGANEDLTPQDIMAMHLEYRRVTRGRQVFHAQQHIMSELARTILHWKLRPHFPVDHLHVFELGRNILRNLRENWPSIIQFDEDIARNLNVYHPPGYRERIQNAWNCIRECTARQNFIFHLVFIIILLVWPFSLMFMGAKYILQCPMTSFLPATILLIGFVGILALSLRLLLIFIEKFCWFPMRTVISSFWNALKLVEFIYLVALMIQLWFYFDYSPSSDYGYRSFCNKTFYIFAFWMKYISSAFAVLWLTVHFSKAIFWIRRIRYQYMPLFDESSEMHLLR